MASYTVREIIVYDVKSGLLEEDNISSSNMSTDLQTSLLSNKRNTKMQLVPSNFNLKEMSYEDDLYQGVVLGLLYRAAWKS